jgi:phospholipid/cholesterol/gamma-HCH transport system substrate-binding protein
VIKRLAVLAIVAIVVAGVVLYATRSYTGYTAKVVLADAGGLQKGSNVSVGGVDVGTVADLYVDKHDRAVAMLHLDRSAVPLGPGARATVQIDGFFGEREVLLTRGNYRAHPERSSATIPVADSGVSVRLDDVVDSLDTDAQGALRTFLDEQGAALVGRGGDLSATLQQLPQTLPALTSLLGQLSANQQALGDLVERSDRVVGAVATQRSQLGSMINSASGALGALASRRMDLGATVNTAPATLSQARATLASLQGAAIPLSPAADGLRATAPSLTAALHEVPSFANAAIPTLNEVARVAPQLQRLANVGTPVVRALVPLTHSLVGYSRKALIPVTTMLADQGGASGLFGEMEGWARSTQGYDASSHIFRFGATVSAASFKQLLSMLSVPGLPALDRRTAKTSRPATRSAAAAPASAPAPASGPRSSANPLAGVTATLNGAVSGAVKAAQGTVGKLQGAASKLLGTVTGGSSAQGSAQGSGNAVSGLLKYLMGA